MANLCSFSIKVKGEHEKIEHFYNALQQKGNVWLGRGASADLEFEDKNIAKIYGFCKWSIYSALVDNARSMREHPERWSFGDRGDSRDLTFITLDEASKMWNLEIEIYSEESGCCFQEHYLLNNGTFEIDECVRWEEYFLDEFSTKEEAENSLQMSITDAQWAEQYVSVGGFENQEFVI